MMSKKTIQMKIHLGVIFTLFILHFSLFTSCHNPLNQPQQKTAEKSKGYFSLAIDGARTIMPPNALSQFKAFTLVFTNAETDEYSFTLTDRTSATFSNPVELYAGTYSLVVSAYMDTEKTKLLAQGTLAGIEINGGELASRSITLRPIADDGTGSFKWDIKFADDIATDLTTATMTITPLNGGTAEQTKDFIATPEDMSASLTLNSGYYRILVKLQTANSLVEQWETLHIYQNMESEYSFTFEEKHFYPVIFVTTEADSGPGSLRQAITDVPTGGRIIVNPDVKTIALTARLYITKRMTIEGNGVTITRAPSWTTVDYDTQLMAVGGATTIRRIHFKDGLATLNGAAIHNWANLNLESCIFSGNRAIGVGARGGAIYTEGGTLNVKGCTFVSNSGGNSDGAIYQEAYVATTAKVILAGNLFYGNISATNNYSPVFSNYGAVVSDGYNASDTPSLVSATGSYVSSENDKTFSGLPVSPLSFRPLSDSPAANIIAALPADYPADDFYGNTITANAAAGAVQSSTNAGYYLGLSVNNSAAGSVSVTPPLDADGIAAANEVTITATMADPAAGYELRWLVNGRKTASTGDNALQLTLAGHTYVQALFEKVVPVTIFTDEIGSAATTEGTLRYALTNAQNGDVIHIGTSGQTISLKSELPDITASITIEGNSVTLTQSGNFRLMSINVADAEVTIRRVCFKDGRTSYQGGAAIYLTDGTLTLESCIFSGNQGFTGTTGAVQGGAIYNSTGTLNVTGCTFVSNSVPDFGGAIYNVGTLTLIGNLFYGNTARGNPSVVSGGTVTSGGYNVADTTSPGYTLVTGSDKTISVIPVSPLTCRLLSGSGTAGVITTLPDGYPTEDFYGVAITDGAAAGAVQSTVSGSGYYLAISVNNTAAGTYTVAPEPDAEGIVPADEVTITATANNGYRLREWLSNGRTTGGDDNPLVFTLSQHTIVQAVFERSVTVTSFADTNTAGTLRYALNNTQEGDIIQLVGVIPGETTIQLSSRLPTINKSITIEGNGVTITRAATWTTIGSETQFMYISNEDADVTIRRVWFKDGRSTSGGGALTKYVGTLTLESCIFSGNQNSQTNDACGGAIYNRTGTMNVKGCTFYDNRSNGYGGAINNGGGSGNCRLTGNLFFRNTAPNSPVISFGTRTSYGYNVVDVALGTRSAESGFAANANGTDKTISVIPVSPVNFRLLSGSGAADVITTLPNGYPTEDFYGETIAVGAAAGAVQGSTESGYYLGLSVNNTAAGTIDVTPPLNDEGIATANEVTITATLLDDSVYTLKHWLVNGSIHDDTDNPLTLTLEGHTIVQAIFGRTVKVTNFSGSTSGAGTLRYAIGNAQDGDIIYLDKDTAGTSVIELTTALTINRSVTIEGNGVTLTKTSTTNFRLMNIMATAESVTIRQLWFKDGGGVNFTADSDGGAIRKASGTLTLESCIFSGSRTGASHGGAIYNTSGVLNVKGCTFVANRSNYDGGAIFMNSGTLTLTGNLFYGNISTIGTVVYFSAGTATATSMGYNVVDNNSPYFTMVTGDVTIATIWGNNTTTPFADETTYAPKPELSNATYGIPQAWGSIATNMPVADFYGNVRTWPGAAGAVTQ